MGLMILAFFMGGVAAVCALSLGASLVLAVGIYSFAGAASILVIAGAIYLARCAPRQTGHKGNAPT